MVELPEWLRALSYGRLRNTGTDVHKGKERNVVVIQIDGKESGGVENHIRQTQRRMVVIRAWRRSLLLLSVHLDVIAEGGEKGGKGGLGL